jgi:GNAT superfamily N-acetyltransferase
MADSLQIAPVHGHREVREVVQFPFALYGSDPNWVPPLIGDRIKHYDPGHNPFFQHAEMQLFRAVRDGRTVGTIAAIADRLHQEVWNEPVGFFGVFEVIEDYAVAKALFEAASAWLSARGLKVMRGPMNLNINDECGLLIDPYDEPPYVMMAYNKPYYRTFIERYGFVKAKDLYAFEAPIYQFGTNPDEIPGQIARLANVAVNRYRVRMRSVDMPNLMRDVELIKPIYRQAWSKNWGALPMTDAEFTFLANELKTIVDPDLTFLAFIDDQPVGCFVSLPNYNEILPYANGHLWPLGWAKLLWHKKEISTLRVLIMGVLEQHRLKGIEALFYHRACEVAYAKGYRRAEMSWILEDNYNVIRGIERMGGQISRTYRMYDKALG